MAVYKRYRGKRVTSRDPNYKNGTWVAEGAIDGVRYHKSLKSAETKDEAKKAEDLIIAQIHHGELDFLKDKTHFSDYVDTCYLPYALLHNPSYKQKVTETKSLKKYFKDILLKSITPRSINLFISKRLTEKVHCQKCEHGNHKLSECDAGTVSPSTVNRELATLSSIMSLAIIDRKIRENPCKLVKKLSEPEARESFLTKKEKLKLFDALKKNRQLLALVLIALNTGWRKGQILALRKGSLDHDLQAVKLIKSKQQKTRTVPVSNFTWKVLTSLADARQDYLFIHERTNKPLKSFDKSWRSALTTAEIEGFHFHDLRHTFATDFLSNGASEKTIQTSLGHSNIKTTQKYTHVLDKNLREALEQMTDSIHQDAILTASEDN